MEPRAGRKRPWENDDPIGLHFKRRGSNSVVHAASASRQPSPLPHEAGYYSRDNHLLDERRLPPLYTPSYSTSVGTSTTPSVQVPAPAQWSSLLDSPRPRSQSLFNVFQQHDWQGDEHRAERPIDYIRTLESAASPPLVSTEVHRPQFGTGPAPHAAGGLICCPLNCQGQKCLNARTLMRELSAELALLQQKVGVITKIGPHSSDQSSRVENTSITDALTQALKFVQWSNLNLQEHLDRQPSLHPDMSGQSNAPPDMKRSQHYFEEREERPPTSRQHPNVHHGYSGLAPSTNPEDARRLTYHSGEIHSLGSSPHHTASSPGSVFMPPQSPMQAPQPIRSTILPSPSSLNFPNTLTLHSMSPTSAAGQASAQSAHLQDLQHQISVKTLAFQTLQREYDSLLQKLERQRTKCATLEKKFEVSDVEINSLTDEKEKLHAQIATLECQVEDLQQSRDEARRQLVANGAQYMQIMEMANKLQGKGAEDKKKWEAEKSDLEQRIRLLEEAMVTGTEQTPSETAVPSSASPGLSSIVRSQESVTPSATQSETINVLRAEVARLRSRTQSLETALQTMRQESISIQAAARQLVHSGSKIEDVAQSTVGSGG